MGVKLKLGNAVLRPNVGVPQGSLLSPCLFKVYFETALKELMMAGIDFQDLLVYADDLLIICDRPEKLKEVIRRLCQVLRQEGTKKSPVIEFKERRSKKKVLTGMESEGIPRVYRYRYLGLVFDEKLTIFVFLRI